MNLERASPVHLERIAIIATAAPSFVVPRAWKSADFVHIAHNDAMTRLDLGGLETVGRLLVGENAMLTDLALGSLQHVHELDLGYNPQFSSSVFDGVQVDRDVSP
jgi:hypothetical protein